MKGWCTMATFINLLRFSGQSASDIKESPARLEQIKKAIQAFGGELKGFYVLMGQYDALLIVDAPDDEAAMKFALAAFSSGGIDTETMRAFTEEEFNNIIASMP